MCIGIPMQVQSVEGRWAQVAGRGEQRQVDTALVAPVAPGDWLLVFLADARERIDALRAAEVNAALDLLFGALSGAPGWADASAAPGFALPSQMSAAELRALTQETR